MKKNWRHRENQESSCKNISLCYDSMKIIIYDNMIKNVTKLIKRFCVSHFFVSSSLKDVLLCWNRKLLKHELISFILIVCVKKQISWLEPSRFVYMVRIKFVIKKVKKKSISRKVRFSLGWTFLLISYFVIFIKQYIWLIFKPPLPRSIGAWFYKI